MYRKVLPVVPAIALFAISCGSNESKETVVTDTVVKTEVVTERIEVAAPIDSAAVVKYYEEAHATKQGKHTVTHKPHKKVKNKQVAIDSGEPIEHHDVVSVPTAAPAASNTVTQVVVVHDVDTVYFRPDEPASFPGGEKAFDTYLSENLEYPEDALNEGKQGVVFAMVSINELGNITKVSFPEGRLGYGMNREVERVLIASPRWNPAKHAGKAVSSKFTIPIRFSFK